VRNMQPHPSASYDRASTIFSPDGRIFQVNYAMEAVRKGATAIALRCSDGVVLLAVRREYSRLIEPETVEKLHQIDEHIGCATTGIIADGRVLVDIARWEAQRYRFLHDDPVPVRELADHLGEYLTAHTLYGGMRPYGSALLIGGMDSYGPLVIVADPSGTLYEFNAAVRGQGHDAARDYLLTHHDPEQTVEKGAMVGVKALLNTNGDDEKILIHVATVSGEPPLFAEMRADEIDALAGRARTELSTESGKGGD